MYYYRCSIDAAHEVRVGKLYHNYGTSKPWCPTCRKPISSTNISSTAYQTPMGYDNSSTLKAIEPDDPVRQPRMTSFFAPKPDPAPATRSMSEVAVASGSRLTITSCNNNNNNNNNNASSAMELVTDTIEAPSDQTVIKPLTAQELSSLSPVTRRTRPDTASA